MVNYFLNGHLIGFKDTIGILFLAILIHVKLKLSDAYYFFVNLGHLTSIWRHQQDFEKNEISNYGPNSPHDHFFAEIIFLQ